MGKVEENIKNILLDLKNSRFQHEISKKELLLIINRYSLSPYGYLNRLWIDGYIKQINENIFQIINLEYKKNSLDSNKIKEGFDEG